MLETHIMRSLLIFRLVLLLMFHLISFMELTIVHMVLVHERIALCLDALVTTHVLIVVIVPPCRYDFLARGFYTRLPRHSGGPRFSRRVSRPTHSNGEVQNTVKTSSGRMVKCWISKFYLTNLSTEPSTSSRPV
jgi:hypothetical protein